MRISIIVPTRNQSKELAECLFYLSNQRFQADEIIVVDNNSDEHESKAIHSLCRSMNVIYCFEPKQGSYAARNYGLSIATGDLIGFTDSDCKPWPSWISGAVLAFEVHGYEAIAGHINFTFSSSPQPIGELIDSFTHLDQEKYANHDYGAGANLWMRRSAIEKVGEFNAKMMNLGDREWGQRARGCGVTVHYSSLVTIDHPARNWNGLLHKIWVQMKWKHYLEPFTWRNIFTAAIVPRQNYISALRDPNLPGIKKIVFILALHWIGLVQAVRILQLIVSTGRVH